MEAITFGTKLRGDITDAGIVAGGFDPSCFARARSLGFVDEDFRSFEPCIGGGATCHRVCRRDDRLDGRPGGWFLNTARDRIFKNP